MALPDDAFVQRPFADLPGEESWVAVREILPAAYFTVRTDAAHGAHQVTVASALPALWPAWRRADGAAFVGMQTHFTSQDRSRDVAAAILAALDVEPDTAVESIEIGAGPRLQDILDGEPGPVTVADGFGFWTSSDGRNTPATKNRTTDGSATGDDAAATDGEPAESAAGGTTGELATAVLEQTSDLITPTAAIDGVPGAYWAEFSGKQFVRWVRGENEDALFDALARLHARRENQVIAGAKFAGAFRACGLVIPVWELPRGTSAADLTGPAAAFGARLTQALAEGADLTALERQARAGLVSRSVTLR